MAPGTAQSVARRYVAPDGAVRVALAKQPLSPNGPSKGPTTMAEGGIQKILAELGATVRVDEARLTAQQETEYGGWKKLGMSLGHFADLVASNERDGYFTVGLLATCPSMPGLVAGLQRSATTTEALRIGMLWLDAHPDFNTPETTRSGSLGGMPVAVATGRALQVMRLDATLDPPLSDRHVVMGGVRLTDPLEQRLLDDSMIEQLSVDDLRNLTRPSGRSSTGSTASATRSTCTSTWTCSTRARSWPTATRCPAARRASSRRLVRGDLPALSQGLGHRLRDHPTDRRRRAVDRGAEPDDRRRGARAEGPAGRGQSRQSSCQGQPVARP